MARTRTGWIKENDDTYSEGVFYKVNRALIRRGENVILRNTWTGDEKIIGRGFTSKKRAREFMINFMKKNPAR